MAGNSMAPFTTAITLAEPSSKRTRLLALSSGYEVVAVPATSAIVETQTPSHLEAVEVSCNYPVTGPGVHRFVTVCGREIKTNKNKNFGR